MAEKIVPVIYPGAIVDDASWTCQEVDTFGFNFCKFVFQLGATDIAMVALKLQESDTSGSGFTDVTGTNFATDGTLPSATNDNKLFAICVNLTGRKRYLKPVATGGNGSTGTYLSAFAVLSGAHQSPNSATERGFTGELVV